MTPTNASAPRWLDPARWLVVPDRECVYESHTPYRRLLQQLAALAASPIAAAPISERWDRTQHAVVICVQCVVEARPLTLWIPRGGDELDVRFLGAINARLRARGAAFVMADTDPPRIGLVDGRGIAVQGQQPGMRLQWFGDDDWRQLFLATADHRLRIHDYAGLIAEATALLDTGMADGDVYTLRGCAWYESGQADAAWADWAAAAAHGAPSVYAAMAARYALRP